ncbi:MAG: PAS domain-containing protein [Chitinophagaceae bacterium]|nr:PAS domain-containing protein [Chitinophagaceae bacterium]
MKDIYAAKCLSGLKVLILEDNEDDAYILQRRLKKHFENCECMVSEDEADFTKALNIFQPQVVLADNSLLNFNAADALKVVRRASKDTVFIMVTGMLSEKLAADIIRGGGDDYVVKDRLFRISTIVDAALRRRRKEDEQEEAVERLSQRAIKYRELLGGISEGVVAVDSVGIISYMNDAASKLLGERSRTSIGAGFRESFPELAQSNYLNMLRNTFTDTDTLPRTHYLKTSDTWIEGRCTPAKNGVIFYLKDVTGEIRANELVKETEEKYQHYFDRMSESFISLDQNWCYTYINLVARKYLEHASGRSTLIGLNIWDVFPDQVGSEAYKALQLAMTEQRYVSVIDYYEPTDYWYETHAYPSPDGLSIFVRDITGQVKAEAELAKQKKKTERERIRASLAAKEKERNAIGRELHDNVNQILASANLFLTLINESPERAKELVPFCIDSIKKAIGENRRIAHELVTPDLLNQTFASEIEHLFTTMLTPAGIETIIQLDPADENLITQEQKLELYRILQEQCSNIVKYAFANKVTFRLIRSAHSITISLTDDGRGADLKSLKRGIGLKNIASRVTVLGGEMKTSSSPGNGFCLEVSVPV